MALSPNSIPQLGPGKYHDEHGLYLQVTQGKGGKITRSWIVRYMLNSKARDMGVGTVRLPGDRDTRKVTLAQAREARDKARAMLRDGIDPLDAREAKQNAAKLEAAKSVTFKQCALEYIAANEAGWRNAKHKAQWANTLEQYVYPQIGSLPVKDIDTELVLKVLKPIWNTKTETASRVRQRIEAVLSYATVHHYRSGDNPARWRGHLDKVLPKPTKVRKKKHHPALPYTQAPAFMSALRQRDSLGAKALEFVILCGVRAGDITGQKGQDAKPGAKWDQIDWTARVWTISSPKVDDDEEQEGHRVPLSDAALAVLKGLQGIAQGEYIFPSPSGGKPISNTTLKKAMRSAGDWRDKRGQQVTVHGFRSTFSDWAAEQTNVPYEIREKALAHRVGNETAQAYQRGDLLEKRRKLMQAWARFCASPPAVASDKVVAIGSHRRGR